MKKIIFLLTVMITVVFPIIVLAEGRPVTWQCPIAANITNDNGTWIVHVHDNKGFGTWVTTFRQPNSRPMQLVGGSLYPLPDPYIDYECRYKTQNNTIGWIEIESDKVSFAPVEKQVDETACIYGHNTPTFQNPAKEYCGTGTDSKGSLSDRCLITCQAM